MNQTSHKSESLNQTPLLLRYKQRDCLDGDEVEINPNTGEWIGEWTDLENPDQGSEIWQLQLPDSGDFISDQNEDIQYFERHEFRVMGAADPVVVMFDWLCPGGHDPARTYRLPEDYSIADKMAWNNVFLFNIRPVLYEYERHRGEWKIRIVMRRSLL